MSCDYMNRRLRILLPTGTRADFPRIEPVINLLAKDKTLELLIAVTGLHLLDSHGKTIEYFEKTYGSKVVTFPMFQDPPDDTPRGVCSAFSRCTEHFSVVVEKFKPDVCLITVDRVETLAFASVSALMNIPVLHVQGGEVSGTVDENIRHAVSKLAHVHSVANKDAARRLIQMGESSERIFVTGCPYSEILIGVQKQKPATRSEIISKVLGEINLSTPYSIFCMHPVTTDKNDFGIAELDVPRVIEHLAKYGSVIVLTPNTDLGFSRIFSMLEDRSGSRIKVLKNIDPESYLPVLASATLLVGNSSSGIREAGYFGLPVIDIGSRQKGRLIGSNVVRVPAVTKDVFEAIDRIINEELSFEPEFLYGELGGAEKIVKIIKHTPWKQIPLAKTFIDIDIEV